MIQTRLIGGILLVIGTSIGAGMLGLPIASAQLGFGGSVFLLCVCWLAMLICAFLILEANLWLPHNTNLVSMAKTTIGPIGQVVAWVAYLTLLYSLLCAYIAGGTDLFRNLIGMIKVHPPIWLAAILFTVLFGSVVYSGMSTVDKTNRLLMILKFTTFFIVVFLLIPFISVPNLYEGDLKQLGSISAITVTATAFGWATLVPSLRTYFSGNVRQLKIVATVGSLIPLLCYILWDAAIMGVLPLGGNQGLAVIANASNTTSSLVDTLSTTVHNSSITFFIKFFTSICVLTSFLGVALCLTDFLADGLQIEKKGRGKILIHLITFLPGLAIAIFFPNVFIKALEYAGLCCTILLILLPAWMVWCGRYRRKIESKTFMVGGGKILLAVIVAFSFLLIGYTLFG